MIKKFINIFIIVLFVFLILNCEAFKKLTPEEFAWYTDEPYIVKMTPPPGSDLTNDPPTPITIQFSKTMDKSWTEIIHYNVKIDKWSETKYKDDTVVITSSNSQWVSSPPDSTNFTIYGEDIYENLLKEDGDSYTYNVP